MEKDIQQVLITQEQIRQRIAELGEQISAEYAGKNPLVIGVLKGVVVFFSDMIRQIRIPCEIDFLWLSSYSGTTSTHKVKVHQGASADIKGRHVLILEDIFDTGSSLNFTYDYIMQHQPASVKICTLLDKPSRRKPEISLKADYVGFEVPDVFVVGYGLDYNEKYRNLPFVGILDPKAYQ